MIQASEPSEETRQIVMRAVYREKLGKLRSYCPYLPPGVRRLYLQLLAELEEGLGAQ